MAGQFTEEDLKFMLTVDPDVNAVEKAIATVEDSLTKAGKKKSFWKQFQANVEDAFKGGFKTEAGAAAGMAGGMITGAGRGVASGLSSLQGGTGVFGAALDAAGGILSKLSEVAKVIPVVGEALGAFVEALAAVPGIIKDITESLIYMAARASPTLFMTWRRALDDVTAVIGRAFIPVLELMRDGVRLFGDVLASMLPNAEEVRSALSDFRSAFEEFGQAVREVVAAVGPEVREFLLMNVRVIGVVLGSVARAVATFLKALGFSGGELRSSQGAAAQEAHFSSASEYQKTLQLAAFREPGKDDAKRAADDLDGIKMFLDSQLLPLAEAAGVQVQFLITTMGIISGHLEVTADFVGKIYTFVEQFVMNPVGKGAEVAMDGVKKVMDATEDYDYFTAPGLINKLRKMF